MNNFVKYVLIGIVAVLLFPLVMKVVGFIVGTAFSLVGLLITILFYAFIGYILYKLFGKFFGSKG